MVCWQIFFLENSKDEESQILDNCFRDDILLGNVLILHETILRHLHETSLPQRVLGLAEEEGSCVSALWRIKMDNKQSTSSPQIFAVKRSLFILCLSDNFDAELGSRLPAPKMCHLKDLFIFRIIKLLS